MSRYVFLFGMDSIIVQDEILPVIAKRAGLYEKMEILEESTKHVNMPFKQSFLTKAHLLNGIPVSDVWESVSDISLNLKVVDFIRQNRDRCYIVTGNIDVWIEQLINRIGMERNTYCSKALTDNKGYVQDIVSIVDKDTVVRQMIMPYVAVGNGNNDAEMIEKAEIGIGYGGSHEIASSVLECASHAVYDEERLVGFLNKLL